MEVYSIQNLIVGAIPQRVVANYRALCIDRALCIAASVLLGSSAASAQAVPPPPPLALWNAVELTSATEPGKTYIIEQSSDLQLWVAIGGTVYGDGELSGNLVSNAGEANGNGFYRLKVETLPAEGHSRWSMSGCNMVLSTDAGACLMNFGNDGSGRMTLEAGGIPFAWDWLRTGRDSGCVTITWSGGVVESMDMHFLGKGAGVFSSRRVVDGIPAGASAGTFRDAGDSPLALSVPAALGNALITFSGSGRPVAVELKAGGAAAISSPVATGSFTSSYMVTGTTTATLILECSSGVTESWELNFTGPACGTYSSTSQRNGKLRRSATGAFTIAQH